MHLFSMVSSFIWDTIDNYMWQSTSKELIVNTKYTFPSLKSHVKFYIVNLRMKCKVLCINVKKWWSHGAVYHQWKICTHSNVISNQNGIPTLQPCFDAIITLVLRHKHRAYNWTILAETIANKVAIPHCSNIGTALVFDGVLPICLRDVNLLCNQYFGQEIGQIMSYTFRVLKRNVSSVICVKWIEAGFRWMITFWEKSTYRYKSFCNYLFMA